MQYAADTKYLIEDLAALGQLSGPLSDASLKKEIDFVHPLYAEIISASPFCTLATHSSSGIDISPRGDSPGFVHLQNSKTLLLPERRGNNRMDSLRNITSNPSVALLFFVPGLGETLRVAGRAKISIDPGLLVRFAVDGKPAKCVLIISVDKVFFQCARAIQRSKLWSNIDPQAKRNVPTPGSILSALTKGEFDGETYDRELPARQKATLY